MYEFNIYPNLRCPSVVQARIRLKSKSQHLGRVSPKYQVEPTLFEPPRARLPYIPDTTSYNYRRSQDSRSNLNDANSSYRYHTPQNQQGVDLLDSSFNQPQNLGPSGIDIPHHFQAPQVSTHKIYVNSMTPTPTPMQHRQLHYQAPSRSPDSSSAINYTPNSSAGNYPIVNMSKSYTSMAHSGRDKQRVAYMAEFTVKNGQTTSNQPAQHYSSGQGGLAGSPQMAKSYSCITTNTAIPYQNQSTANICAAICHTPMAKSYSNFSACVEDANNTNYSQKNLYYQDGQNFEVTLFYF